MSGESFTGRSNPFEGRKLFTVERANAALPLVRAIARDLADLAREVVDRRERLAALMDGRQRGSDVYSDELEQVEQELEKDTRQLQEYVEELRVLGVEPKNAPEGLIDFPAIMDGRPVWLCWKLGEGEVLYWHDLETGFQGRQPLTADSLSGSAGHGDGNHSGGGESID